MPDDPLDTNTPPSTPPAVVLSPGKKFKCVFCECVMTGEKDEEIAQLREQLRVVTAERDALKGSGASPAHKAGARVTRNQG